MKELTSQAHSSYSLLVVEDDEMSRDLLGMMIGNRCPDMTIHYAEDGRTGLELFKRHMPVVVITDVNLPVMDGVQMVTEIRALRPDTKIIVITAYSNGDYLDKFNELGCSAYISKPIMFGRLFDAIQDCFSK